MHRLAPAILKENVANVSPQASLQRSDFMRTAVQYREGSSPEGMVCALAQFLCLGQEERKHMRVLALAMTGHPMPDDPIQVVLPRLDHLAFAE